MNLGSFFKELKRRHVYRVAVAYAVVSWLLIQIATQVFPFFEVPNWAVRLVILLLALGFPVALILSWAFEITPEGIKRDEDVDPNQSRRPRTGRKIVGLTITLAIIAAALLVFQLMRPKASTRAVSSAPPASVLVPAIPEKSIAVLPFENLSDEKANAYFADGIQDEILTRLSKIGALKVISRTSTQKYKSAPANLREIALELGVANLLEGSVQRIGNKVHINVQLIRAATDEHLWAEVFNRTLDDVFAVEGEVAGAIAEQLKATLTGAEQRAISERLTQNVSAYDAYLRALAIEYDSFSYSNFDQAAKAYSEAVRLDPQFAAAWARLAVTQSFLYFNGLDSNINSAAAVKDAVDHAVALQPDASETWLALGSYRYRVLRDFSGALQAFDEARKQLPNSSYVLQHMAYVERRLGQWENALQHYRRAAELDPRDFQVFVSMGSECLVFLRRFKEAHAALDRALEIAPNDEGTLTNIAVVLQAEGRLPEAAKVLDRIPAGSNEFADISRIGLLLSERQFEEAAALIKRRVGEAEPNGSLTSAAKTFLVQLGYCQEWMKQPNEAKAAFARAVETIKPSPDSAVISDNLGLPAYLALAYAGLGEREKALEQARHAVAAYETDAMLKPFAETVLAQIQARFGDLDSALAALPHLLEVPAGITRADLRFNPLWDPLRKDRRFAKFIGEPAK